MCKGLSIDDGVSRDNVFQEVRSGAGFETGDFVKEKLGGLPQNDSLDVLPSLILLPCNCTGGSNRTHSQTSEIIN